MSKRQWLDRTLNKAIRLQDWYFDPVFLNTQHIQADKPALFVGNHTLYGLTDGPLLWDYLCREHNIFLRALGDKVHFKIPGWREAMLINGAVEGSPENCRRLMQKGESILVYPGGSREVFKRKGEKYQLIWKQRTGFARMAIEHGYDIIPFAALGGDDCYDIVLDANDIQSNKFSSGLIKN